MDPEPKISSKKSLPALLQIWRLTEGNRPRYLLAVIAPVGPSGGGKSTFVSLLSLFSEPTSGSLGALTNQRGSCYELYLKQFRKKVLNRKLEAFLDQ
ncbi:hypothetical protein [Candidatus Pelagisphaera phototrophica]|uniref:hypothetical protein n=1 Tax=Candidatus Pelagisphaera phototrophica TaxID=2684113 RepID=UPI0019E1CF99|nr:hypothetical protein [Candidatus Pelagisphaera phototrophica]QXD33171.1 hypothetical protein GA004_05540 [Candidatus Pelagisphaera phototrophica]